jgi:membrane carboxypeptidase/penicillin-binding protein PbpC
LDRVLAEVRWRTVFDQSSLVDQENLTDIEIACLLLEDRHYFRHSGIDYRCVPRLIKRLLLRMRFGGISTIEQQLVRTVSGDRQRKARRKIKEIILARILTYHLGKIEILRTYLSIAYFGHGLWGCDKAANFIFGKDSALLSREEAALVAGLLVYPLSKTVKEKTYLFPVSNIGAFFNSTRHFAENWTNNVERRQRFALALFQSKKAIGKIINA